MEREVDVRDVEEVSGRSGTTRFVLRDDEDNEYTTFRPQRPGGDALQGQRAVITFHEEERRGFRNVYLDAVTAASPTQTDPQAAEHPHPDESAWETALEAAPWIVGTRESQEPVPAEELYERLHPFKELVADDIRRSQTPQDQDDPKS
jgi:hypothetical protein